MIPRYSRKEMQRIWDSDNKFRIWLDIEIYACEAQAELGLIPKSVPQNLREKARFDPARIAEIEQDTKHDVVAFLANLAEHLGDDAQYVHFGMTSSDVLDTCLSVQLAQSTDILLHALSALLAALRRKAEEYRYLPCVGRSHGVHAEPMTFGLKMARFYAEFKRGYDRLKLAKKEVAACKISGAMGNFAMIDPFVQEHVAKAMGLASVDSATQVIPRDRYAMFFAVLGILASSVENIATEIRHLQRTEIREVEEYFSSAQTGSSAMPHKRNPVLSENLVGLARLVRSYTIPAMENIALWHERDISHSSVERVIAPDACIALDFALHRLVQVIDNLIVYPDNMKKNLGLLRGLIFSQRVLLELIKTGLSRAEAYKIVQSNAMHVWQNQQTDFFAALKNDANVASRISTEKLKELINIEFYHKHLDYIFGKIFNEHI
ncbi:adenylosuccinate lyase [Rickettsiales bacterium]|nr:adenylosuccinate lyase [Rickettsiales bacterium]